jgi:NAD(P)-dependent dehydrogenase (short-subunit alcohol dehydrogenase family)
MNSKKENTMSHDAAFDLTDKVALVTGASSGLGQHFASLLAKNGAKVALAARRLDKLTQQVNTLREHGAQVCAIELDVTSTESVIKAFNDIESRWGTITIVSNNAGIAESKKALDIDEASWDKVLETNLKGVWRVAMQAGGRAIAANTPCSIVNTASILGLRVAMAQSSYATSKAAVVQLTQSLALEWSRKNIRVNALCPGYFLTEINRDYFESDHGKNYIAAMPMRRLGQLQELSAPFLLLASDAGSFINGVALPVDGGHAIANM